MGAGGARRGELEHARAEGGQDPVVRRHRGVEGIERVEVCGHVRVGTAVVRRERRVACADAQEEAPGEPGLEVADGGPDVVRRRCPDADDAAGHGDACRRGQQPLEPGGEAGVVAAR